jgi:hypothetical protein
MIDPERVRLTESQIAAGIGRGVGAVRAIVDTSEQDGIVARDGDHWLLTTAAVERLGFGLRALEPRS